MDIPEIEDRDFEDDTLLILTIVEQCEDPLDILPLKLRRLELWKSSPGINDNLLDALRFFSLASSIFPHN